MANATTGAPAPTQHPFINPDDADGTEYAQARAIAIDTYDDHAPDTKHLYGLIYVLNGLRDAVKYLSHLEAVPASNVTKLGVGDE